MSGQLKRQKLPAEVQDELDEGARWFSTTARFERLQKENYFYCVEADALVDKFSKLLAFFSDQTPAIETRITALHFEQPASIPVKKGSTVDVIPVHLKAGEPTIGGEKLELGEYVRLTTETPVEPDVYCLLLLRQ